MTKLSTNSSLKQHEKGVKFYFYNTLFFKSNTFVINARLKLAKNQANAKQHCEAKFCCLKITHIFQAKILEYFFLKKAKEQVCVNL